MLELLATKHDDWVRIALSMTGNIDDARDLVQDMYLRLERLGKTREEISYKDTVNRYFSWTVLFNMYKVSKRAKVHKKLDTCELFEDEGVEVTEYNSDEDFAFSSITDSINNIVSDWKPYDKKLFDLYFMQGLSLRQIAKGANIGLNSIHNSVKSYREALREELSEDLMDYFNGDYDKID